MKLKICGLKDPKNILEVAALNPDMIGFIFYEGSKRYVGSQLRKVDFTVMPDHILKTGIFVNENSDYIIRKTREFSLDQVQLHGNELPLECSLIRKRAKVIKAFGVNESFDFAICEPYENVCDLFLFDTADANYGGTGRTFDHSLLKRYKGKTPFFLSGGIGLAEAENILKSDLHPLLVGLDVNSKFEDANCLKNVEALKKLTELMQINQPCF